MPVTRECLAMARVDADRNLLFGVLAMPQELIDAARFADACAG
jgi:hypothetical protein